MTLINFPAPCFAIQGKNELDTKKCDAQIPNIIKNLRSTNKVRGNNRHKGGY
jgi:hypothetical protein